MSISIIVPFYNAWHLTHQCLMDLYKSGQGKYEILLVDDESTEADVYKGLKWWKSLSEENIFSFRYIRQEKNGGFGSSMNLGAEKSTGDILIFLSNDVRILSTKFDLGAEVKANLDLQPKALVGGQVVDWAGGWNEVDVDGKHLIIPYIYGWLIACTREAWNDIGGFDPIYAPYDYEDVDLCLSAILKGYRLIPLNSPFLQHVSGGTISSVSSAEKRMNQTKKNREKFIAKWAETLSKAEDKLWKVAQYQT